MLAILHSATDRVARRAQTRGLSKASVTVMWATAESESLGRIRTTRTELGLGVPRAGHRFACGKFAPPHDAVAAPTTFLPWPNRLMSQYLRGKVHMPTDNAQ
jgi:hypothetical protein